MVIDAMKAALENGVNSAEYAAVISMPECRNVIISQAEQYVEWAAYGTSDYDDGFLFDIGGHVDKWRAVFSDEMLLKYSEEIRGSKNLNGLANKEYADGKKFCDQLWWPK